MNYPLDEVKKEIITILTKALSQLKIDCKIKIEIPPENLGDFAFPCFQLAGLVKKSPNDIAKNIDKNISHCRRLFGARSWRRGHGDALCTSAPPVSSSQSGWFL